MQETLGTWVWSLDWEDSPGEGNDNQLQYSCLENSMDRGAWQATVHGVPKSQTWQSIHAWTLSKRVEDGIKQLYYNQVKDKGGSESRYQTQNSCLNHTPLPKNYAGDKIKKKEIGGNEKCPQIRWHFSICICPPHQISKARPTWT